MEIINSLSSTMNKEGKDWWWCPKHRNGKGFRARHKHKDHGKPLQLRKREEIAADAGTDSNYEHNTSRKLALSRNMKIALLKMGMLTDEQAESIAQEIQIHLPKDF